LSRVDGGKLALRDFRGKKVLLVFSDPDCEPCDMLAPYLEKAARTRTDVQVVMVSRGKVEENLPKIAQHGFTFPLVLHQRWEVSREYARFAAPVGYLIDEQGIIAADVAVGPGPVLALLASAAVEEPTALAA